MNTTLQLMGADAPGKIAANPNALQLDNDINPVTLNLQGIERIDLDFPKFTDGRAYSQAYLLRQRLGFAGELRATGDVLADQLLQIARCGFSSAVLRADQDLARAQHQLHHFNTFYQGDAAKSQPRFALPTQRSEVTS